MTERTIVLSACTITLFEDVSLKSIKKHEIILISLICCFISVLTWSYKELRAVYQELRLFLLQPFC